MRLTRRGPLDRVTSQRTALPFGSRFAALAHVTALFAALSIAGLQPALAQTATTHHKKSTAASDRPPASARPIYESIVVDANTGRVLHQINADTPAYPASLTKMMTLYMLFDALDKGKVRLDTPMKVSMHAATQDPSKLDLPVGSTIAVEQAIYAVVTKSANDVAVVIAEHLGGTEEHFAQMMTARAKVIGMTRSQFRNASGLPNKGQISTARDMAILGKRLMTQFPDKFAYFSKTEFPFRGVLIKGHNHLMENYDGADGIKTGYTAASGFNLVASARRGEQRLIAVMFGGASAKIRDDHVAALLDAGFGVVQRGPEAEAVAQAVDPFPAKPELQAATANVPVQLTTSDGATPSVAAGDADDAIARQITTEQPAPPLAETAALVPAPTGVTPRSSAARAAALRADAAPLAAAPVASWGIQVGAFTNRLMAENRAKAAAAAVGANFASANPRVTPIVVKNHQTLYRAQVVGLDHKDTMKACVLAAKAKLTSADCKVVAPDQKNVAMR